jgi:hypothetical protein
VGFILNGILAYAGGWVRESRKIDTWKAIAILSGVVFVTNMAIFVVLIIVLLATAGSEVVRGAGIGQTMLGVLSTVGWTAGLVVSGFPKILHGARNGPLSIANPFGQPLPKA